MKGLPGVDSSSLVTTERDGKLLPQIAKDLFGVFPIFWGRYFTSINTPGDVEYRHRKEDRILRENGIRVLPIGRNTTAVGGSAADGTNDARLQVGDLLATFDRVYLAEQGGRFFLFLDVEGHPHSLSPDYYAGWAKTVIDYSRTRTQGAVEIRPCLYASRDDTPTWEALDRVTADGIPCDGVWVAYWLKEGPDVDTQIGCLAQPEWDPAKITPPIPLNCPVLFWQYSAQCRGGSGFDCNQTNPNLDAERDILPYLILPPGAEAAKPHAAPPNMDGLVEEMRVKVRTLIANCLSNGIEMRPYQTIREPFQQARLWRQSRSHEEIAAKIDELKSAGALFLAHCLESVGPQFGDHVTNAVPGLSWHQWGEAVDSVWIVDGAAEWSTTRKVGGKNGYRAYGEEAARLGLTAGGFFTKLKDWPHVQLRAGGSPLSVMSLVEIDRAMDARFG